VAISLQVSSAIAHTLAFYLYRTVGLDFCDEASATAGNSDATLAGGGRDRAFSFECFAFGINADEPLPPIEQSSMHSPNLLESIGYTTHRPRGDSIIFDPSSFQDGGIHEQSALEKALGRAPSLDIPACLPKPRQSAAVPSVTTSSSVRLAAPSSYAPIPTAVLSSAPLVSSVSSINIPVGASTGSPALSLDLVNKDGRIGIYLPEARRARIARFHAKRAKRIWRKRIKYDCRKKLADSRPRIKGRFVKRSDMEED
jgi:hypothetical protein